MMPFRKNYYYCKPLTSVAFTFICFLLLNGCVQRKRPISASSLDSALMSFQLPEQFKIEILASEPLIGDPVDMEIDEYGRLYVVEMPGYPLNKSGTGTIKLLFDTNGDGRMDSSTVFADRLVLPNSVMRWKKGILVTDAPYVLYFEDLNGDNKSDVRDTVLTGFALSNPQHNLNSPLLGLDNWIYLAHEGAVSTNTYQEAFGDRGTEIYFPRQSLSPRLGINANGRSVRFKPDGFLLEETSGRSQFGHTFDQWGHHFLVGNANHIYQEVIAAPYLARNEHLLLSSVSESLSDHGNAAEIFPVTEDPQHQLLTDVGVITSACGLTSYLGGAFPEPYIEDVTFVCEPVSNLVHVDKLQQKGSTFVASRIRDQEEFLASRDARFRPVNLYIGPDGALYVVDYYRKIIEHPEWMDDKVIRSGELYNDSDRGRIYRISAKGMQPPEWTKGIALGTASSVDLVKKLSDKNVWWRMNAQRMLIDRRDTSVVNELRDAATQSPSSAGRVHALWTLEGLHMLTPEMIAHSLKDTSPGVRENAIRLAEPHLATSPQLVTSLLSLAVDPDGKVRYQLLCTIGSVKTLDADQVRKHLLFKDLEDPWVQVAALSAAEGSATTLLDEATKRALTNPEPYLSLIERLSAQVVSIDDRQGLKKLVKSATETPPSFEPHSAHIQAALINGMAIGHESDKHTGSSLAATQPALVEALLIHPSPEVGRAALRLLSTLPTISNIHFHESLSKARALATDSSQSDARRALAIGLLGLQKSVLYKSTYLDLLSPHEPMPVQLAAIRSLSKISGTEVSLILIDRWPTLTPEIHDAAMATFLDNDERTALLLGALEEGKIKLSSVSWPRRVRLMAQSNLPLRNRARTLFTKSDPAEMRSSLSGVLSAKGDVLKGQEVYQQHCALCHQIRGKSGGNLGPDLGTVHNWSREAILSNIVDPNQSISSGFDLWSVVLVSGRETQGIIASESPGALTLRNIGTADQTINRNEIQTLKTLNMSVMPDDFGNKISHQQLADLLAFLKQNH